MSDGRTSTRLAVIAQEDDALGLLVGLGVLVLFIWLVARTVRPQNAAPKLDDARGHQLVEALYRDGVKLGYKRAWDHQLAAEDRRVAAFVRRRTRTVLVSMGSGAVIAALPLGAALGAWPNQGAWLPALPQWQWLLLAALVLVFHAGLAYLLAPRDYRKFSGTPQATRAEFGRLNDEIESLLGVDAAANLSAMKSYVSALAESRFADGVRHGRSQDTAGAQTRISSAANAAYVQGRNDGATEARGQVSQLTTEAYLRGVGDGERTAVTKLEGRISSEREAAYQSGYRVGVSEGRAASTRAAHANSGPRPAPAAARPRTRAEALANFELSESVSAEEISRRYRELQTALHPDVLKGRKATRVMIKFAEEQFKLVGEAYEILQRAG